MTTVFGPEKKFTKFIKFITSMTGYAVRNYYTHYTTPQTLLFPPLLRLSGHILQCITLWFVQSIPTITKTYFSRISHDVRRMIWSRYAQFFTIHRGRTTPSWIEIKVWKARDYGVSRCCPPSPNTDARL